MTYTTEAGNLLASLVLDIQKHGKQFRAQLDERRRKKKKEVWVTFNRTCEGAMSEIPDSFFDEFLIKHGATIEVPTTIFAMAYIQYMVS